jgi:putative transposase
MPRKRHSAEDIVSKLRQADVLLAQGQTGTDVARVLGVTETSYVMSGAVSGPM